MISRDVRAYLAACSAEQAADALARMHADDAADALHDMGSERRDAVTRALPARQRRRVAVLLGDEPATAGTLMGHRFLALYEDSTVSEALDRVRGSGLDPELVAVVFVANRERRLLGALTLKRLLESPPDAPLDDVMQLAPKALRTDATFEEVARLVTDFDLLAAPVVDHDGHIVGIVTADDVLEVLMPEGWRRRFSPDPE
ncbi:MAG TPA: CBS domain-containing protein [Solirubrobacteraceae bacterium]